MTRPVRVFSAVLCAVLAIGLVVIEILHPSTTLIRGGTFVFAGFLLFLSIGHTIRAAWTQ